MSNWLPPATPSADAVAFRPDARAERKLRAWDLSLAAACLLVVGVPLAAARLIGRLERRPQLGAHGREVHRHTLALPDHVLGRAFSKLGARHWPQVLDVLRGDLAWVGPTWLEKSPIRDIPEAACVRPGLVSLWSIRRRTAVDFGTQAESDLEYLGNRSLKHDIGVLVRGALVGLLPLPSHAPDGRVRICDVAFENVTMPEAVARLRDMLDGQQTRQVSFVNPACVNIAASDRGYRRALARADMVLPDGIGTKIAGDMLGTPIKQNVNGTDLFPRLCDMLDARGASLFLLGGQQGVPDAVAQAILSRWPGIRIVGKRDGFFSVAQEGDVAAEVRASGADVLLVARGVPMQDVFIDRYLPMFGVKIAMGVGGLFDFVSGRINRAPRWMRDSGLEWVYRLMQEPGRMWKRYLVGNFTFLGRVALQRLGLRQPADDVVVTPSTQGAPASTAASRTAMPSGIRAVVFAAEAVAADIPAAPDHPGALLPLGHASFIERCMELLAMSSIAEVDLVVSNRPEALRRLVGNGQRWGLRIHWHLAKDCERPYDVLRVIDFSGARRVIIGHASEWMRPDAMQQLANRDQRAMIRETDGSLHWAGWAAVPPAVLQQVEPGFDRAQLADLVGSKAHAALYLFSEQVARNHSAAALLAAQHAVVASEDLFELPGAWISTTWGGLSPSARVHPGARIEGPVLIGPGCFVADGAVIGPHAVLTRDVVVSAGTLVRDSVVLPETFLGSGLDLSATVVNGNRVSHVALGVNMVLPASDGLLLKLKSTRLRPPARLVSRAVAVLLLGIGAPLSLLDSAQRKLRGRPLRWTARSVVTGVDEQNGECTLSVLRCPDPDLRGGLPALLAHAGPALDVLEGRRRWFGMRARSAEAWQALNPDWQAMLASSQVGVFHAPSGARTPDERPEAEAAADAFQAVQHSTADNLRTLAASLRVLRRGSRANRGVMTPEVIRPVWRPMASEHADEAPASVAAAAPVAPVVQVARQPEMVDA